MNDEKKKVNEETIQEEDVKAEEPADTENPETEEASEASEDQPVKEPEESTDAQYVRLMADFQNYKRRAEKEKGDIYAYANEKIVLQLLDVIDNFERALNHDSADEGYAEGMKMIFQQLTGVLEKAGLEEIVALGEDFDPNFHNAVMTEDNADFESGKVTAVMQKGYLLNSKVIRPVMVKVNN